MAAGGENRVGRHADNGRTQARLRRHTGHLRIGHGHRNHNRADDEARNQIIAQPGALVRFDPAAVSHTAEVPTLTSAMNMKVMTALIRPSSAAHKSNFKYGRG